MTSYTEFTICSVFTIVVKTRPFSFMPQCASCFATRPRDFFSAAQLKKKSEQRRCKACTGLRDSKLGEIMASCSLHEDVAASPVSLTDGLPDDILLLVGQALIGEGLQTFVALHCVSAAVRAVLQPVRAQALQQLRESMPISTLRHLSRKLRIEHSISTSRETLAARLVATRSQRWWRTAANDATLHAAIASKDLGRLRAALASVCVCGSMLCLCPHVTEGAMQRARWACCDMERKQSAEEQRRWLQRSSSLTQLASHYYTSIDSTLRDKQESKRIEAANMMSNTTPRHVRESWCRQNPEWVPDARSQGMQSATPAATGWALPPPVEQPVEQQPSVELVLDDPDLVECILASLTPHALGRCALLSKHYWATCMSEVRWLKLRRAQRLRQVPFDPMEARMEARAEAVLKPEGYRRWAWAYRCAQTREEFGRKHLVWIVGRPTKGWPHGSPDWPAVTQSRGYNPSLGVSVGPGTFGVDQDGLSLGVSVVPGTFDQNEAATVQVRVVRCPEISSMIRVPPRRLVGWESGLAFWRSHDGAPFASTRVFLESEGRATARTAAVEQSLAQLAMGELPDEVRPWF